MSNSTSPTSDDAAPPASPCVRRCCLDEREVCLGCGRTLAEILEWSRADNVRRAQILHDAQQRLAAKPL
ncbi:DUF1289 domain-containing protein [Atopomonas hussainii]|uniref:DUF1289 domain-containing protein n=1 Tax=Atopomonas hussainii TaxID=1429083 RepID=UPI0009000B00|nr:DUF1289 domain-containing protein [Atopomonas hussainii]